MAVLDDNPDWLRVRPPLVAMDSAAFEALAQQIRGFGIARDLD